VLREALMYVGIPLAAITGLYLWKQARVHRLVARR
jgi:thiosulfate reductase cytochrome b subunit